MKIGDIGYWDQYGIKQKNFYFKIVEIKENTFTYIYLEDSDYEFKFIHDLIANRCKILTNIERILYL